MWFGEEDRLIMCLVPLKALIKQRLHTLNSKSPSTVDNHTMSLVAGTFLSRRNGNLGTDCHSYKHYFDLHYHSVSSGRQQSPTV